MRIDHEKAAERDRIAAENPRRHGEKERAWTRRLSGISGGAISPETFRRAKWRERDAAIRTGKKTAERTTDKVVLDERKDDMSWSYDGSANITNLQQALAFSKVDLDIWEVDRHVFNTWTTTSKDGQKWNVQVKVWFKRRRDHDIDWGEALKGVLTAARKVRTTRVKGHGVGFITTADFHLGAYVDDLIRSGTFNIEVLVQYLTRAAEIVNGRKYKQVYVAMLGDFIESFTGLNHTNSWKGLGKGMYGMNAIILCSEILVSAFLGKINNLTWVGMVSGNHDRTTSEKEGDQKGEVGTMLHYLLKKTLLRVPVEYHPMILTKEVDNVYYVMTHGHLPITKRDPSKILFDYGRQGLFNVLLSGHTHSRSTKRSMKSTTMQWNDSTVVSMDEADYRVLVAPPMFTGNFFSEGLGYSSSAGFLEIQSNGRGRINVFDYCL
jgi:predicted phosphodiesterase